MDSFVVKNLSAIFLVTFFLVFILLLMVQPYIDCTEDLNAIIPECRIFTFTGELMLGLLLAGALFLIDLGIVYLLLSDLWM